MLFTGTKMLQSRPSLTMQKAESFAEHLRDQLAQQPAQIPTAALPNLTEGLLRRAAVITSLYEGGQIWKGMFEKDIWV